MKRRARLVLALAALATAGGIGLVSVQRARDQLAVLQGCEAAQRGDTATALARTAGRTGPDATGRAAVECRCQALLATGASQACTDLVAGLLADPDAGDWAPPPELARESIHALRDAGRTGEAAELARRAARQNPDDADLFDLELQTRAGVEDEAGVLRELEARVPVRGDAAARMRVSLAQRYLRRGDAPHALAVLGDAPPQGTGASLGLWYDTLGVARAMNDDVAGAQRAYQDWGRAGGDAAELRARYALALSIAGLREPGRDVVSMLRDALAQGDHLRDPKLHEALAIRLVITLVASGRVDDALAVYDRAHERFAMEGLSRQEIERSARQRQLAQLPADARRGALRLRVQGARPGATLWLSPDVDDPVDTAYTPLPVPASGVVAAERSAGVAPQRWVLRDAQHRLLGSGTLSPRAGETLDATLRAGTPRQDPPRVHLARAPGDGRRRVALIVLDCGDWRIAGYLAARGELPVFQALLASGWHAVLESEPPLTGAALEALVWPQRRGGASLVGWAHRLGVEVAGLASVGDNPLDFLSWVLPESEDLFSTLGAGSHSAANLLLAHGGIRAGRNGDVTGPGGARRRLAMGRSARDLDPRERARWPELAAAVAGSERDAHQIRSIAAELDAAVDVLRKGQVDLLALRVEPLDLMTHAHFADSVRDGQDDGRGILFSVYRYIDARLLEVNDALDADDVLIVMSDHGIRTAMEHSRHAIFVVTGAGVPRGRAAGNPGLRGVSRVLADLLGVATSWPDTGAAPWAESATGRALARPAPSADAARGS